MTVRTRLSRLEGRSGGSAGWWAMVRSNPELEALFGHLPEPTIEEKRELLEALEGLEPAE